MRYVYYDVSADPAALMRYLLRGQTWLYSGAYRDLGLAYRAPRAGRKPVWIVVAGFRSR